MVPHGHRVLVGTGRVHQVRTVLPHHGRNAFLHKIVMIAPEEPSVGIVVVEENVSSLGGSGGFIVTVQAAFPSPQDHQVAGKLGRADAFEVKAGHRLSIGTAGWEQ